jgi:aspartate aminotransferase-like enzyme
MGYLNLSTGPTYMPESVTKNLTQEVISHRSQEFQEMFCGISNDMKKLANSETPPLMLTCSGTGGLDATISSFITPKDKVLVLSCGYYGDLLCKILDSKNNIYHKISFKMGDQIGLDVLTDVLRTEEFHYVLLTHNESSTGVTNPLGCIVPLIQKYSSAYIIVDAISSFGAIPINLQNHKIDALITSTQKALMSPPGLSFVFLSNRLIDRLNTIGSAGSYYFDLKLYLNAQLEKQTPFTPSVSGCYGLQAALTSMYAEGLDNVYSRHLEAARLCRNIFLDLDWEIVANERCRSNTITAIKIPSYISSASFLQRALEKDYGISVSIGNGMWTESIIRVGHMGSIRKESLLILRKVVYSIDKKHRGSNHI